MADCVREGGESVHSGTRQLPRSQDRSTGIYKYSRLDFWCYWPGGCPDGTVYVSSFGTHRIFRIGPDGTSTVFAGMGSAGFSGDGGPAIQASLNGPQAMAFDKSGNLFFVDSGNYRIRRIA